jgi:hypothetical protein
MGLWGSYVLCRTEQSLEEIKALNCGGEDVEAAGDLGQGWQLGECADVLDDAQATLEELARTTGAPTLAGLVFDSDCVDVHGYGVSTGHFRACLDRENMAGYLEGDAEMDQVFLPPADAAARAAAWAGEAGLRPDHDALAELFGNAEADPFAEDLFFDLIHALGIDEAPSSS